MASSNINFRTCSAIEVTAQSLNVRINPSTNNTPINSIHKGEKYVPIRKDGPWRKIWFNHKTYWIASKAIRGQRKYTKKSNEECIVVKSSPIKVYSSSNTRYRNIGTIPNNSQWVLVNKDNNVWKQIYFQGKKGWIKTSDDILSPETPIITGGLSKEGKEWMNQNFGKFSINSDADFTNSKKVTITLPKESESFIDLYQISENKNLEGATWKAFTSRKFTFNLSPNYDEKTLYFRVFNKMIRKKSKIKSQTIEYVKDKESSIPDFELSEEYAEFTINHSKPKTITRTVAIDFPSSDVYQVNKYQISEYKNFKDTEWKKYTPSFNFTLSPNFGEKKLYLRVQIKGYDVVSKIKSQTIEYVENPLREYEVPVADKDKKIKIDSDIFLEEYENEFGWLSFKKQEALKQVLTFIERDGYASHDNAWLFKHEIAYLLATIKYQTMHKFTPVLEKISSRCEKYDGGCEYRGRGYSQLTGKRNYKKMNALTYDEDKYPEGHDFVYTPSKALEADLAYQILSYGSFSGAFTGRKLGRYINKRKISYYNARRAFNGTHKARLIRGYANKFYRILKKAIKK
jgi:uncharacterized protein YgiM (DUF1202 family)